MIKIVELFHLQAPKPDFGAWAQIHAGTVEMSEKPGVIHELGRYRSRAIWRKSKDARGRRPAVVLVPGSGEVGPEGMVPIYHPGTGRDGYPLLTSFAQPFFAAGFHTLQLGKPGVEVFSTWEKVHAGENFYDKTLWLKLRWEDLLTNVEEAIRFLQSDPTVDPSQIFLLGHSEGSVVAADVAARNPDLAGVVILGFPSEPISQILFYQVIEQPVDEVIAKDIDRDQDGILTEGDAKLWPEEALFPPTLLRAGVAWDWVSRPHLSVAEVKAMWEQDPELLRITDIEKWIERFPFWRDFAKRSDMSEVVASIRGEVYAFVGEFDTNTPPAWTQKLRDVCLARGKHCEIRVVPGVTHNFSRVSATFAGPHFNKVLDQGSNPVDQEFLRILDAFAESVRP